VAKDDMNGVPATIGNNAPEKKNPQYWTSESGQIAIKLDMVVGDIALVAMAGAEMQTRGAAIFWYPDASVTIIGCQDKEITIQLLENALDTLRKADIE
jgi:hypothetical protein